MPNFRSKFEAGFHAKLPKGSSTYESHVIPYVIPASNHKYHPDFYIKSLDLHLELKGVLTAKDRKKMLLVKEQHPDLNIAMVFQRHTNPINKGSKTTYSDWCDKHGLKWMTPEEAIKLIKSEGPRS